MKRFKRGDIVMTKAFGRYITLLITEPKELIPESNINSGVVVKSDSKFFTAGDYFERIENDDLEMSPAEIKLIDPSSYS